MTFAESVRTCFSKYVDFNGVATRSEFWWFILFLVIVGVVTNYISPTIGGVFALATILPQLAVGARRLHETGRSGWWQLLMLIPLIGTIILIVFWAQPAKS
ncbi:MAG TPA: DUF805 domain-containing protein [Gammaproteobacteria bacterium]|nr:DUF805 domain-containing protein [Gammaproteobacteria bacterium]